MIQSLDYGVEYSAPNSLAWLNNKSVSYLFTIKWAFTFGFTFLFLILTILFTNIIFNNKSLFKYAVLTFLFTITIALIIYFIGFIFPKQQEKFYLCSRFIMGILQSPLITVILLFAFKIFEENRIKHTN